MTDDIDPKDIDPKDIEPPLEDEPEPPGTDRVPYPKPKEPEENPE